jgi:hypothetical protein
MAAADSGGGGDDPYSKARNLFQNEVYPGFINDVFAPRHSGILHDLDIWSSSFWSGKMHAHL